MRLSILLLGFSLLVAPACASSVGRGTTLYQQQSYVEAAEVFERTQNRLTTMDTDERIHYGLYRGLTLKALGDLRGAARWLDYAEARERAQPGLLVGNEHALLSRNRSELTEQLKAAWPKAKPGWTEGVAATSRETTGDLETSTR